MKNSGGGVLLSNRHATKHVCPESAAAEERGLSLPIPREISILRSIVAKDLAFLRAALRTQRLRVILFRALAIPTPRLFHSLTLRLFYLPSMKRRSQQIHHQPDRRLRRSPRGIPVRIHFYNVQSHQLPLARYPEQQFINLRKV